MYKRVELSDILRGTGNKKAETITIRCKNCGQDKEVNHNLVWAKFCDDKCYKEYLAEQRNIKKILAVINR
jgi:transcription elongation factor Elf1